MVILRLKFIFGICLICIGLISSRAYAESSKLPVIMHGQTQYAEYNGFGLGQSKFVYGGMTGNEAILNYNPDYKIGFDKNALTTGNCYNQNLNPALSPVYGLNCFVFPGLIHQDAVNLMTSWTYVLDANGDRKRKLETAALSYSSRTISGDAYSVDSFLNNFKFWGRNLAQSGGSVSNTQATWKFGNYIQNPDAQSTWTSSETKEYMAKLDTLARNAIVLSPPALLTSNSQWSLQSSGQSPSSFESNNNSAGVDKPKYPEGKVWLVNGDLLINRSITYYGVGTIIVRGNIYIMPGYNILPHDEKTDHLGIIVLND